MDCDLLLYWMTHIAQGSWEGFRRSVQQLAQVDDDLPGLCRHLRVALSDMGYAGFFVDGSQRWKIFPPVLGGLALRKDACVLSGGRNPSLIAKLESAATARGCQVERYAEKLEPTRIYVTGTEKLLAESAAEAHIPYLNNLASSLCESLIPIFEQLEHIEEKRPPINWKVRSFELQSLKWIDGLLPRSACEYTPSYGKPQYYYHKRRGRVVPMNKRDAVYASTATADISLVAYDPESSELSTPIEAPLPEQLARIACLCSGLPAHIDRGRLCYGEVPQEIATILQVAVGQRCLQITNRAGVSV